MRKRQKKEEERRTREECARKAIGKGNRGDIKSITDIKWRNFANSKGLGFFVIGDGFLSGSSTGPPATPSSPDSPPDSAMRGIDTGGFPPFERGVRVSNREEFSEKYMGYPANALYPEVATRGRILSRCLLAPLFWRMAVELGMDASAPPTAAADTNDGDRAVAHIRILNDADPPAPTVATIWYGYGA